MSIGAVFMKLMVFKADFETAPFDRSGIPPAYLAAARPLTAPSDSQCRGPWQDMVRPAAAVTCAPGSPGPPRRRSSSDPRIRIGHRKVCRGAPCPPPGPARHRRARSPWWNRRRARASPPRGGREPARAAPPRSERANVRPAARRRACIGKRQSESLPRSCARGGRHHIRAERTRRRCGPRAGWLPASRGDPNGSG